MFLREIRTHICDNQLQQTISVHNINSLIEVIRNSLKVKKEEEITLINKNSKTTNSFMREIPDEDNIENDNLTKKNKDSLIIIETNLGLVL
jgi:vacuolar-type H+-ATPase subunit I/STV1